MAFIPLAEETGIILAIGRWALFSACQHLARWVSRHDIYVSANLSVKEFADPQLLDSIETALNKAEIRDPRCLKLEVTETRCMEDPERMIRRMEELAQKGIDTFIDDFGTGYSSLGYLKRLPAETFKIDRMFIEALAESREEREYLSRIIDTMKSRRKKIIVEGVGSGEQYALLKGMRCDWMQGFYFSRPLPAPAFEGLLDRKVMLPTDPP